MNVEQDLHCTSALTAVPTSNNECIHQPEIHNIVKSKMQPRQSDEIKKKTLESLTLFCRFNKPHPSLEFPPLYFVLERFPEIREGIKAFYAWRWNISYPLQKRVPGSQFLRYFRIYLTYGEIVLLIALTALPSACVYYTLVAPSVSGTGKAARLAVIAALLFAQKNSYITMVLGVPFDRAVPYHKIFGYLAVFAGLLHGVSYFLVLQQKSQVEAVTLQQESSRIPQASIQDEKGFYMNQSSFHKCFQDSMNTSGTVILAFTVCIFLTSLPTIRRKFFEIFYFIHLIFLLGIIGGTAVHTGFMVPILVAGTTGLDLFIRKIIMARYMYPRKATLNIVSETVVQISFPKVAGFDYNPGQYVYMAVPELSSFEWHPFSISSAPHQAAVTMHIRVAGNWTGALHKLALEKSEVPILLEGPYGNFGVDVTSEKRYKEFLFLSGGIGVTPMQSMFCHLLHEHSTGVRQLKKLKFVWVQRDPELMLQSQVVADASTTSLYGSKTSESINCENYDKDTPGHDDSTSGRDSLASKILSNAPPSYETDAELDIIYASTEIKFPNDGEDELNLDHSVSSSGSVPTAAFPHYPSEAYDDKLKVVDDAAALNQAFQDKGFSNFKEVECESEISGCDVVDIEIYLTGNNVKRAMDKAQATSAQNDIPGLRLGRPDLASLLIKMREHAINLNEKRVAVCVCGPKRISYLARKACIELSDKKVCFDYHEEAFG